MIKLNDFEKKFTESEEKLEHEEDIKKAKELLLKYLLKKNNSKERRKLLKEFNNGAAITGPDGLRKKLAAIDLAYFGRAYFGHYFIRESPKFHAELDKIWIDGVLQGKNPLEYKDQLVKPKGCNRAIAAPRGHAKSTNFTFKDTLHATLYQYKHFIMILSDSSEQAEGFLEDIKNELEENKAIIEDFGRLESDKCWTKSVIVTSTDIKVQAIGSGKKVRGRRHRNWRPDLIVLDDIENDELVRTIEQRKKLSNWYFKAVSKAGDDYTDILYIGTLLHYDSLLANILKNPGYKSVKYKAVISFANNQGLWDMWKDIYTDLENPNREEESYNFYLENKEEMLEGTKVLWEQKLSYYDLMVMRISEGNASFNSEEQNEPVNPEECLFNPEWFDYYNEADVDFKDRKFSFIGFIDPSLGKTKKSDYSTIVVLAKDTKAGYMYEARADIERRHPDKIIEDILETERWLRREFGRGFLKLGVETNQFQWFLKEQIAKASAKEGLYLPIEEVNQNSDKVMRIETLQPYIKNSYIKFNPRSKTLLEQLKVFPMGSHDDGPDALEGAVKLANVSGSTKTEYKSVIKKLFSKKGAY